MVRPTVIQTSAVSAHRQADLVRASLMFAPAAGHDRPDAHVADPLRATRPTHEPPSRGPS